MDWNEFMGNKKIYFCIVMFLVILIFGIVGPDLSKRDKYLEEKYSTTEESCVSITTEAEVITETTNTTDYETLTQETSTTEFEISTEESSLQEEDTIEDDIDKIIARMTVEEKVGQMLFIKNDGRFTGEILDEYRVGGVILFNGDFQGKTEDVVKSSIKDLQDNSTIPLLIGVDEEGGTVVRLSCYSHLAPYQFRSPRDLYFMGGFEEVENDAIYKSEILLSYGINVNFAPVCDVVKSTGDFMFSRSFSEDAELTGEYIELVITTMSECKIGSVMKHFPGYGNNMDTHNQVVRDTRSMDEFISRDLIPFEKGIEAGAYCVLVSHNIVECMDKDNPASLSPKVIDYLRSDMGFEGVIITDDLKMGGVSTIYTSEEAAVLAVLAGNDMILSTDYQVQYKAILEAVNTGRISEERIDESVRRILEWKYSLELIE